MVSICHWSNLADLIEGTLMGGKDDKSGLTIFCDWIYATCGLAGFWVGALCIILSRGPKNLMEGTRANWANILNDCITLLLLNKDKYLFSLTQRYNNIFSLIVFDIIYFIPVQETNSWAKCQINYIFFFWCISQKISLATIEFV